MKCTPRFGPSLLLLALLVAQLPPSAAREVEGGFLARGLKTPQVDELTVVVHKHETYGDQVKKAAIGAVIGLVLVILAFPVLYYNEKRQVHMDKIFEYASKVVKQNVPPAKVDPRYEASLVHMCGTTACAATLQDSDFNVSVQNCARLVRSVEMYQWVEHESKEERDAPGGGKDVTYTYTYSTAWRSDRVDSSSFKEGGHENPDMPLTSKTYKAPCVTFGAFRLPESLVSQMQKSLSPTSDEQSNSAGVAGRSFALVDGAFTTVKGSPEVGDMRVSFKKTPCGDATVLSLQHGNSFEPLTYDMVPSSGCCSGVPDKVTLPDGKDAPLLGASTAAARPGPCCLCECVGGLIEMGESLNQLAEERVSARGMIAQAKSGQQCIHCSLKVCGFLMFYIGYVLQLSFVPALFRVIPWIGVWMQAFGNIFAMAAAAPMAVACWCITVAYAWLAMRPLQAVLLVAVAAAVVALPAMYTPDVQWQ